MSEIDTKANVAVESSEGIVAVTMVRPERRNALSSAMMRALIDAFVANARLPETRAFVLRGEGPAFSSGHDLRELRDIDEGRSRALFATCVELMETIQRVPQPVIAEVDGVATAAGCQLVATCDLAVASERATFATPGVRIGLFCTTPAVALGRAIGRKRALKMLFTGDPIDAWTAEAWGLVNDVVAADALGSATRELARSISTASRSTLALGKAAFYEMADRPQSEAYARACSVMTTNAIDQNAQEGIDAFLSKRKARYVS